MVSDQRINKICDSLQSFGFEITLIGRKLPNSLPISRSYKVIRMRMLFNKGFLFYAEYNTRLFFKLLFLKTDILLANDLDTLLPNYLISHLFHKKLVYDSHEFFTEVPELISRPKVRNVWLQIEKFIFPKLKNVYTVNDKIAEIYSEKYKIPVKVIRNIAPKLQDRKIDLEFSQKIKGHKKMLILQGSGINMDRGAEEAVLMMKYLKNCVLFIIGGGDVFSNLSQIIHENNLKDQVILINKVPYKTLMEYTKIADLGLSLDKGSNLNYEYSLPNKIFDYIQAEIPVLVSNRIVLSGLVQKNNIGSVCNTHDPKALAKIVQDIFKDEQLYELWKKNVKKAALNYTWENESKKLKEIYSNLK